MTRDSKKETRHENRCRKKPQLLFSTNKQPTVFMTSLLFTVSAEMDVKWFQKCPKKRVKKVY